eukprot:1413285-Pyramimonas_sp.AAC.1
MPTLNMVPFCFVQWGENNVPVRLRQQLYALPNKPNPPPAGAEEGTGAGAEGGTEAGDDEGLLGWHE